MSEGARRARASKSASMPWVKTAAGKAGEPKRKAQGANQQRSLSRDKRPMAACEQAVVNCIFEYLNRSCCHATILLPLQAVLSDI